MKKICTTNFCILLLIILQLFVITPSYANTTQSSGNSWAQSGTDGFGDSNNSHIHSLTSFQSQFYTGTDNEVTGAELYRTLDGINWIQIVGPNKDAKVSSGFGDKNNEEIHYIIEYNSYLYATTYNPENGAEIWRSKDGIKWDKVVSGGFGNKNNIDVQSMAILGSDLYAGTWNQQGAEVYKTSDGINWTKSAENGFGDNNNRIIISMINFNNYIYAGTRSWGAAGAIWRTNNGNNWEKVNTDGFGDSNNRSVDAFGVYQNQLYTAEYNTNGVEIYSTSDAIKWSKVVGNGLTGTNLSGFGNKENISIFSFYTYDDKTLYAGTYNEKGCEIWTSTDGKNWNKIVGQGLTGTNLPGFGDNNNIAIDVFNKFDNYLYAGTDSSYYDESKGLYLSKTGFEVWKHKLYDKSVKQAQKNNIVHDNYIWIILIMIVILVIVVLIICSKKQQIK